MEDIWETLEAVLEDTKEYNIPDTAVCLMGHGTTDRANAVYEVCQRLLKENGYDRYFIGTVEADPTLDQVVQKVEKGNYRRVVLQPFMLVAGDHANQDMAGMGKNSWKSTFERKGTRSSAGSGDWASCRGSGGFTSATPRRPHARSFSS